MPVGEQLLEAYRDLLEAEARLSRQLAPRGVQLGSTLARRWPVLHDYLNLYVRGLSPAGMVVFGGAPDDGSRLTGIPFTGAREAREHLNLAAAGGARSPSGEAFWNAVRRAREMAGGAPLEGLFDTVHLAHAVPFDAPFAPEAHEAAASHVRRVLARARPQAAVCVGADALAIVGIALGEPDLVDLARAPEASWAQRWPVGSRLLAYPSVEVGSPAFRLRIVPVPSLTGRHAQAGEDTLSALLASAWA